MRRTFRFFFMLVAVASLLLCIATVGLWVRTGRGAEYLIVRRGDRAYSLISDHGAIQWTQARYTWRDPGPRTGVEYFSTWGGEPDRALDGFIRLILNVDDPVFQSDPPLPARWYDCFAARSGEGHFNGLHSVGPDGLVPPDFRYRRVATHDWVLMAGLSAPPAAWLRHRLRTYRRARRGLCRKCGYDLRATPDRCPECGTPVTR